MKYAPRGPVRVATSILAGFGLSITGLFAAEAQAAGRNFSKATCVSSPWVGEARSGYRLPSIVQAANGDLIAFAEKRNGQNGTVDYGNWDIVSRYSKDGGCTWSGSKTIADNGQHEVSNPSPVVDKATGDILLVASYQNAKSQNWLKVQRSTDNGRTWSKPQEIKKEYKTWSRPLGGLTQPGNGLQLAGGARAGRIIFGAGVSNGIMLVYSDNGGKNWVEGARITSPKGTALIEADLTETPNGQIFITARLKGHGSAKLSHYQATSKDGGATASAFSRIAGMKTVHAYGSLLTVGANMYLATPSNNNAGVLRKGLKLWRSTDNGRTWKSYKSLTADSHAAGYADLVALSNGQIAVIFESGKRAWNERIQVARFNLSEGPRPLPGAPRK